MAGGDLNIQLAFLKPNKGNYSETFIENQQAHINIPKKVLYGGFFPTRIDNGKLLIRNPFHLIEYYIEKNLLKRSHIPIRNRYLKSYFLENKIDIVLAHYGVSGALVHEACSEAGIPLVIHFHGFDAYDQVTLNRYFNDYQASFSYASKIISVSLDMSKALISLGAPESKIVYNPYGVNLKFFQECNPSLSEPVFLSVARFAPKKSPFSTLEAFSKVHKLYPKAKMLMAGIGPLWDNAKKLAEALGIQNNVEFLGVQSPEQVRSLMKISRAFIQHSVTAPGGDKEGTPNSILEASASGLPIVSTYHAGIPEAVIHGETGFLVQEHDTDGMARYMIELVENVELARKMGKKGRLHMEHSYNSKTQIMKLDSILLDSFNEFKSKV
jgi:glycosyltransferase involved in cell wall biosynthesis